MDLLYCSPLTPPHMLAATCNPLVIECVQVVNRLCPTQMFAFLLSLEVGGVGLLWCCTTEQRQGGAWEEGTRGVSKLFCLYYVR